MAENDNLGHLTSVDLVTWFSRQGRELPWRLSRDPWSILVAEMMLQQTQVARVVERWARFLERFPTATVCGQRPLSEVIDEWSGLGYNRRAANLHATAKMVEAEHGGVFPSALAELLALPGIGPYTSRAIRVFAFEEVEAVLDTNVARILARTTGRSLGRKEAQALADANVTTNDPWAWNQAMLDVGAGTCRARQPLCDACPFSEVCRWYKKGCPEPDPAVGSAGVSTKQSKFEGSDRQGRGRLVKALRDGPVSELDLAATMGWSGDHERARKVASGVIADGLVTNREGQYRLAD